MWISCWRREQSTCRARWSNDEIGSSGDLNLAPWVISLGKGTSFTRALRRGKCASAWLKQAAKKDSLL
jgi:hypothetical protein